jgi:hypothetical protein
MGAGHLATELTAATSRPPTACAPTFSHLLPKLTRDSTNVSP